MNEILIRVFDEDANDTVRGVITVEDYGEAKLGLIVTKTKEDENVIVYIKYDQLRLLLGYIAGIMATTHESS